MRTTRLLAALLTGLLLAGCGGSPKPSTMPSKTPSPSPSASSTPTPPALPAAAKEKTKAGAIATARHYVELVNYAQATGDTTALKEIEGTSCRSCRAGRQGIDAVNRAGGKIVGGDIEIRSVRAFRSPPASWLVTLAVKFEPQTIDWPSPRADQHPQGGQLPMNMQIGLSKGQWKVLQWSRGA